VGLIAIFGVGTDAVDLEYVRSRQIQVSITSGVLTNDVADLAMGTAAGRFPQSVSGRSFCT
jgi:hydroxypyruvate reductase